jgi:hypothetical protein
VAQLPAPCDKSNRDWGPNRRADRTLARSGSARAGADRPDTRSDGLQYQIPIDERKLPQARATKADFALSESDAPPGRSQWLIIHDVVRDKFVRYRIPRRDREPLTFEQLLDDGRSALFVASGSGAADRIALLTLRTGRLRWFDSDPSTYGAGVIASVSHDGRSIAVLSTVYAPDDPHGETEDESRAAVGLIDAGTGRYQRIWRSSTMSGSGEGVVTWSPDDQSLAADYVTVDPRNGVEEEFETSVFTLGGKVRRTLPLGWYIVPMSNQAWLTDDQLIAASGTSRGAVVNILTGARIALDTNRVIARTGNWLVMAGAAMEDRPPPLLVRQLTDPSERPWLTFTYPLSLDSLSFAAPS